MKKDSKMKRILARMLVVALVLQMGLPLNVMAAPSELQESETEMPVSEDVSESEEFSQESTKPFPEPSEEEIGNYTAEGYTNERVLDDVFRVATDANGKCVLISYEGNAEEIIVPEPIEVVAAGAFKDVPVKKIVFGDSVKVLETSCMSELEFLEVVDFGYVEQMDHAPICNCTYLKEVTISRAECDVDMFINGYMGNAKATIIIPKEVVSLPEAIGMNQYSMPVEKYVVEEGNLSFEAIDGVLFGIAQNGERTLLGYPAYKQDASYVIPEDVTTIGSRAFEWSLIGLNLKELTISKNVKIIEKEAFNYTKLDRLTLLANIETIADETAFYGFYAFPAGVKEVELGADALQMSDELLSKFLKNTECRKLILPAEYQKEISGKTIASYRHLEEVEISEGNILYKSQNGAVLSKDGTVLYAVPMSSSGAKEFVVPSTVKTIKSDAFSAKLSTLSKPINKVTIPEGVEVVDSNAFDIGYLNVGDKKLEISAVFSGAAEVFADDAIANGGAGVTIYCQIEEADDFKTKFPQCEIVSIGMEFEAPAVVSQTEVVLSGKAEPNSVVKIYVDDVYVKDVVTDASGGWTTYANLPKTSAESWKIYVSNEDGTVLSVSKYVLWNAITDVFIPDEAAESTIMVSGTALRDSIVSIYVDDVKVEEAETNWNGYFCANVELPDASADKEYQVYVRSEREGHVVYTEPKTVKYIDAVVRLESVWMKIPVNRQDDPMHNILDPHWILHQPKLVYLPDMGYPVHYVAEVVNSDEIEKMTFKIAEKHGAEGVELDAIKRENGDWEVEFISDTIVPNYVEIECTLKNGISFTLYACEFAVLIDPSGYVYEVTPEHRVEGATAEIYYKENLSDEEKTLWDAENYEQVNPQVTGADGYYGWDVPVGYWQVVVNKEGYQTAESEWMSVPPIRTNVNLELISTESAVIEAAYLSGNQVKVNFSHYMKAASVTPEAFVAEGLGKVVSVTAYNEIDYKGTKVAKEFIVEFKNKAKTGDEYQLEADGSAMETYAGIKGLGDDDSMVLDLVAAAALLKEVVIPKNVAVKAGTEKTVKLYVKGDGEDLSGFTFEVSGELLKDETYVEAVTNKEGVAEFVIAAEEPCTSWIDVAIAETEATIRVDVLRSDELVDELEAVELNTKDFNITLDKTEYTYTGEPNEPAVKIEDSNKKVLEQDKDYTVSYVNNVNAGNNATVVINGIGAYKGTVEVPFTILAVELKKENIKLSKNAYKLSEYTNEELAQGLLPAVEVKVGELLLTEGKDYVVTAENNKQPGKAKAVVKGINNYAMEVAYEYTIEGVNLAKVKFNKIPTQSILDAPIEIIPTVDAKYLEKTGAKEIKFNMAFEKNDKPGTATIYLYGGEGMNTTGKKKITFKIEKVKLTKDNLVVGTFLGRDDKVVPGIAPQDYTGEALKPAVYVAVKYGEELIALEEGKDYTLSYSNNVKASKLDKAGNPVASAKVTVKGKGNFTGSAARTFVINPIAIGNGETLSDYIAMDVLNIIKYTGKNAKPAPKLYYTANDKKVALKAGKDYKITCEQKGEKDKTVKVEYTINGIGNFKGSAKAFVWVTDEKISVKLSAKTVVYTGKEITLAEDEIKVFRGKTEVDKAHYSVSYLNNVDVGTSTVIISGDGVNLIGEATSAFKITPKVLAEAEDGIHVNLAESKVFTGYPVELGEEEVEVYDSKAEKELIQTKDFTLKYSSNTKIGTAKVTLTGKGNYKGKIVKTFKITKLPEFVSKNMMCIGIPVTFTNKPVKPYLVAWYFENGMLGSDEVVLNPSAVFTISYKDNVNSGTGTVILKPKKGVFEKVTDEQIVSTFRIDKADINDVKANVIKVQPFKGKAVTPKVSLKLGSYKLKEGVDYTVEYENNDSRGRATIIIKAIEKNGEKEGNFTGEKRIHFFIF